jgi:hypothetical protein
LTLGVSGLTTKSQKVLLLLLLLHLLGAAILEEEGTNLSKEGRRSGHNIRLAAIALLLTSCCLPSSSSYLPTQSSKAKAPFSLL